MMKRRKVDDRNRHVVGHQSKFRATECEGDLLEFYDELIDYSMKMSVCPR